MARPTPGASLSEGPAQRGLPHVAMDAVTDHLDKLSDLASAGLLLLLCPSFLACLSLPACGPLFLFGPRFPSPFLPCVFCCG